VKVLNPALFCRTVPLVGRAFLEVFALSLLEIADVYPAGSVIPGGMPETADTAEDHQK